MHFNYFYEPRSAFLHWKGEGVRRNVQLNSKTDPLVQIFVQVMKKPAERGSNILICNSFVINLPQNYGSIEFK